VDAFDRFFKPLLDSVSRDPIQFGNVNQILAGGKLIV